MSNSEQPPIDNGSSLPNKKTTKKTKSLVWLYILLAIGIIAIIIGVLLVTVLKPLPI